MLKLKQDNNLIMDYYNLIISINKKGWKKKYHKKLLQVYQNNKVDILHILNHFPS